MLSKHKGLATMLLTVMIVPSAYPGVEYPVTGDGAIALREGYSRDGPHTIDILS